MSNSRSFTFFSSSSGNVITECLIVLPLLFAIFAGILDLGRLFSQIPWIAQSAYQIALVGGSVPENAGGVFAMDTRADQLAGIPYYMLYEEPIKSTQYIYSATASYPQNSVVVKVQAKLPILINLFAKNFSVEAVGPLLVSGNGTPGNLSVFANSANWYDCCGQIVSTPPLGCFNIDGTPISC